MQQDQMEQPVQPIQQPVNPSSEVLAPANNTLGQSSGSAVPASTTQINIQYAGFWERLVALLIDGLILSAAYLVLIFRGFFVFVILGIGAATSNNEAVSLSIISVLTAAVFFWVVILYLVQVFYFIYFTAKGATLGKKVMGLKVIDETGSNIGYGKSFLREIVGKIVSGLVFNLGYVWVAFDDKKQGWHDKIAGTYVVKN